MYLNGSFVYITSSLILRGSTTVTMTGDKKIGQMEEVQPSETNGTNKAEVIPITDNRDGLQRHLGNRQIQLIAIGGAIGTANFVTISTGLYKGGPASLLMAFILYSGVLALVNNSMAEMAVFMPVSGGFVRLAGRWVDESFGFLAGWNFFLFQALDIPFEITALNLVLTFWSDNIPVAAVVAACVVIYLCVHPISYHGRDLFVDFSVSPAF
jgi:yeast amino acid transporter